MNVVISFFSSNFDKAAQGLAGEGRRLADANGGKLHVLVFGQNSNELVTGLTGIADSITVLAQPELANYQPETYLNTLATFAKELSPGAVLLGNDTYSQELAPRLAHRLGGSAAGDAVEVTAADGKLRVTRGVYGGKAGASIGLA